MTPEEARAAFEDQALGAGLAYVLFAILVAVLVWNEWRHSKDHRAAMRARTEDEEEGRP